MIYNLYIFDRNGTCLYYGEWVRNKVTNLPEEEEFKNMYGLMFSLRSFVKRLSPVDSKEGFLSYQTDKYKLHYYEAPSGLQLIMNTNTKIGNIRDALHQLYCQVFVEYAVKNPLCRLDEPIKSELFKEKLDEFVKALPFYQST